MWSSHFHCKFGEADHSQQFSNIYPLGNEQQLAYMSQKTKISHGEAGTELEHAQNHAQFWAAGQSVSFKKIREYYKANLGRL